MAPFWVRSRESIRVTARFNVRVMVRVKVCVC